MALSRRVITPLAKPVKWTVTVPGSKSFMNRAVLCAALARGRSVLQNPVYCDDTNYLLEALAALGVRFKKQPDQLIVYGTGGQFRTSRQPLNVGNAGTTLRFLLPHLPPGTTITGNARMQQRPIRDLVAALQQLGFVLDCPTGCPPVTLQQRALLYLHPHNHRRPKVTVAGQVSSQYLSSLLLLAPTLPQGLRIRVPGKLVSALYVAMTLAVMRSFGITVKKIGTTTFDIAAQHYRPQRYTIEGDASAATYWWALAALSGSKITVANVPVDTVQADIQFLRYLKMMGCQVKDTIVVGPFDQRLHGVKVNMQTCPDAVMSLAVVAARALGDTTITGVGHLVGKETNRLQTVQLNLRRLGVSARATASTLHIKGRAQKLWSATIPSYDDHRLAMSFAVLGLVVPGVSITQPDCVHKSYPTFWRDLRAVQRQAQRQTIVLTGLRGSGKTTLGKKLAWQWHCGFIDLDRAITQHVQQPLAKYIAQYGWPAFRAIEHRVWRRVVRQKNTIIATGGGTLIYPRNVRLLGDHYVILLTAPLTVLQQRLRLDTPRPSLLNKKGSAITELRTVWQQRRAKYLAVADTVYNASV